MFKSIFIALCIFLSSDVYSSEFEFSVGGGFQYSGIIGTQFALKNEESKYYISLGLPGYSIGMQTLISDNHHHSLGLSVGEIQGLLDGDSRYAFITYNYHFTGFSHNGWVFGAGLGGYDEQAYVPLFGNESINPSTKAMFTVDIGYKF